MVKIRSPESAWLLAYVLTVVLDWSMLKPGQSYGSVSLAGGVALAAILLHGPRVLPWLMVGMLLPGVLLSLSPSQTVLLAGLKMLHTYAAYYLFGEKAPLRQFRVREALRLLCFGPGLVGVIYATAVTTLLSQPGTESDFSMWSPAWSMIWLSDALGILIVVAGLWGLLADRKVLRANWLIETTALISISACGGMLLLAHFNQSALQLTYLCFPLMVWSSLRLGQVGNSVMTVVLLLILGSPTVNQTLPQDVILRQLILLGMALQMGILLTVIRRENEQALANAKLSNQVFQHASEGIMIISAEKKVVAINPAFSRITGYSEVESIGHLSRIFDTRPGNPNQHQSLLLSTLSKSGHWEGEMIDKRKNGEVYPAWLSISAVHDREEHLTHYVGIFSDYTNRKQAEQRVNYLARHDSLTDLFNRNGFHEEFAKALVRASTKRRGLALLFIDLDRFKSINDTLGHDVGDELLSIVAQRLKTHLKHDDVISRLGGDEFTVVLENVHQMLQVSQVAERVLAAISDCYHIDGHELYVTGSIGISMYPHDGSLASQLMRNADMAMYRAKELGKNAYQFYSREMNSTNSQQFSVQAALRFALERNQLQLAFQPQLNLATGAICGMECLLRWHHPEMGMISPAEFIPIAEETGLIVPIGHWVLKTACETAQRWRAAGLDIPKIAVNLSVRQFQPDILVSQVASVLAETGYPAHLLELEVTESLIMRRINEAVEIMQALKGMGVSLAIDDFGTGYSSLSQLKFLPLDILKIDRSFIEGLPHNRDDTAIAQTIIAMAKKLSLCVVAEGVETREQMQALHEAGCDMIQGYYYAKPLSESDMLQFLSGVSCSAPLV